MSFDIELVDTSQTLYSREIGGETETWHPPFAVERHAEGGTYAIGGTCDASLNVTYNYARHFGFRALNGRTAAETIPEMEAAVARLGAERDRDYWASTEGNAGYAVSILLDWARQHPDGVWEVE